jgi:lysozyme family protein
MKRLLATVVLVMHLLAPAVVWAQVKLKDPLDYSLKTYGLILGVALLGGFASWYAKVRKGELPPWSINHLIGELATSALAGLLCFWLCEWANFQPLLTAALTGIAGHMGTQGDQPVRAVGDQAGDEGPLVSLHSIVDRILQAEGGYVDNPDDSGGPTNFGITQAVARANGYEGDMRELPESLARTIYWKRYITRPRFGDVAAVDADIGMELVDTGVNMGPARAAEFFQRALNVFNQSGSRYADLFVDAQVGDITLAALQAYLRWRGADGKKVMLRALNCLQGTFYIELAEARPKDEAFVYGQILQRVQLETAP